MQRKPKLCEIVAVSKGISSETESAITKLHHTNKKPALFEGQERTFEPFNEEDKLPPESVRVQQRAEDQVDQFIEKFSELLDVYFTRDLGNTHANANVEADGTTILAEVPSTFLLALEKELPKVKTFFSELPELDPAEEWEYDPNSALHRAEPRKTHKTKKVPKAIEIVPSTKEHKGQGELIYEDKIVGFWNTARLSGGFSAERKREILRRIGELQKAVRSARERANSTEVERRNDIGKALFGYLLGK